MLFKSTEVHIQFVEMLQKRSKRCSCCHLCECVNILGEAFATVAELAVGTGDVGMGVVDVAGEEDAGMYLAPVTTHLLTILTAGIEIGDLISSRGCYVPTNL